MKPISIFLISSISIALVLFLVRINIFDGEIIYVTGIQRFVEQAPISLSYFIGIGYSASDMEGIESFRLLPTGYLMAFVLIIGIPGLIAYRVYLGRSKKQIHE